MVTKAKMDKWDCFTLENTSAQRRKQFNRVKRDPVDWEKIFISHISHKG
jgi:hypothetical protein